MDIIWYIIDIVDVYYADYYGLFDLYECSDLFILRYIPRDELITMALHLNSYRMEKFVKYCFLYEDELILFKNLYPSVDLAIEYYHYNRSDAYSINNKINVYSKYYNRDGRC